MTPPLAQFPVFESCLLVGKEGAATPGVEAPAFTSIPAMALGIDPKYTPLEDENYRGAPVKYYDLNYGSRHAEITIPESAAYADTIGIPLVGCLGDVTTTGTAGTPTWTASGAIVPGAGPITVTTGSAAVAGTFIQIDTLSNSEVVKVGAGSTTTSIVIDASTPIRFNHLTAVAITTVTGPYTHKISLLNMASSTGSTTTQPPTYTLMHRNGIAPTFNADRYLYGHFNEVKIQAKKDGWCVWDGKALTYVRSAPSADFAPSFSTVRAWPSWQSTVSLAGSQVMNVTDLTISLSREPDIIPTADGSQDPYVIGMGALTPTFSIDFDVAADETVLTYLEQNTRPTFSWTITNGGSGTGLASMTIAAQLTGYKNAPLSVMKTYWGFKAAGDLLANTTNTGNSGGYSPLMVTLTNNVPTYDHKMGMVNEGVSPRGMHLM